MRTLNLLSGAIVLGGLALLGLGCNPQNSPVALDNYKQPAAPTDQNNGLTVPPGGEATTTGQAASTTPDMTQTTSTPETAPVATSTKPTNQSTSTTMTNPQNETLAFPGVLPDKDLENKQIRIKTAKGDIVFELLPKEGPNAASNFYYLVSHKFYDGLTFHRVEPGFVIQGGDPLGNGTGGPGYKFDDDKVNLPYAEGIVAMANAGPNTNGSQFFIMLADTPLPPSYSIFGKVVSGMDVVHKIAVGDKMTSVTVEPFKK